MTFLKPLTGHSETTAPKVTFAANGTMIFGETSTWSNAGLCTGAILTGSTTATWDPLVSPRSFGN